MNIQKLIVATIVSFAIFSCTSSVKKADISDSANPAEEITKMEQAIQQGYTNQVDLLATAEFDKSRAYLKDAKKDLADGDDREDVIESVAYSKAYLDRATELTASRRQKVTGILESRSKAMAAGAKGFPPTSKTMAKIDEDLMGRAENLDKLTPEQISKYQMDYLEVELAAVEERQLGRAKSLIESAKDKSASRFTPKALKTAEIDFKNAEALVKSNRNSTGTFSQQVATADRSAIYLTAVLGETQEGKVKEDVATRIVDQNNRLQALTTELNQAASRQNQLYDENAQLSSTVSGLNTTVSGQSGQLNRQNDELQKANAAVNFQNTLARAQEQFSKDEAEVFQQGNNLVIRLKQIQFPSGKAELPSAAMPLLAKVRDVAQELGPKSVRVEGHTDAIGSEQINKTLSENRAETIAAYFSENGIDRSKVETAGVGFAKPLATNKTKEGRAQNRRVDIIITPENSTAE